MRLAAGLGGTQLTACQAPTAASGDADSDSDGEEAVLSRRRPTPDRAAASGAAPTARVFAQHPPPTWADGLRLEQQASFGMVGAGVRLAPGMRIAELTAEQIEKWCRTHLNPVPVFPAGWRNAAAAAARCSNRCRGTSG